MRVLGIAQLDPEICEIHFANGFIAIIQLQQKPCHFSRRMVTGELLSIIDGFCKLVGGM